MTQPSLQRPLAMLSVAGMIAACLVFMGWGLRTWFVKPLSLYNNQEILNLTAQQQKWTLQVGNAAIREVVLPMQEFPIATWRKGEIIRYQTQVRIPEFLKKSSDSLVFHSYYLWAESYELSINNELVVKGKGSQQLNVVIPPRFIALDKPLIFEIKVDPGHLLWQGISHYGAVAIGPAHQFYPLLNKARSTNAENFLWALLPRLALCLLFCFIYFVYDRREVIFWFCAYGFINSLSLFLNSSYAIELLPPSFPRVEAIDAFRLLGWWPLVYFFMYFFRADSHRLKKLLNAGFAATAVFCIFALSVLPVDQRATPLAVMQLSFFCLAHMFGLVLSTRRLKEHRHQAFLAAILFTACAARLLSYFGWLLPFSGPIEVAYGLALFTVMAAATVSDLGQTVEQKERFKAEVDRQAKELARTEVDRAIARASQMMVHDIRRPFSLLRMLIQTLQHSTDSKAHVQRFTQEAERLSSDVEEMLQDILDLSRDKTPDLSQISLRSLIQLSLKDSFATHPHQNIFVSQDLKHKRSLLGERVKLVRLFTNILSNAIQAMGDKGHLWVRSLEHENGRYENFTEVMIGNSGSFVPAELREKIFDPFFSKDKEDGTGLGLAVCKKIVALHGGEIVCRSEKNLGTEFVIYLPTGATIDADLSGEQTSKPLVMLVDDDLLTLDAWRMTLNDATLLSFRSPSECLTYLARYPEVLSSITAIVTDFRFTQGEMSGADLAKQLHQLAPDLRIFSSTNSMLAKKQAPDVFKDHLEKRAYSFAELKSFI